MLFLSSVCAVVLDNPAWPETGRESPYCDAGSCGSCTEQCDCGTVPIVVDRWSPTRGRVGRLFLDAVWLVCSRTQAPLQCFHSGSHFFSVSQRQQSSVSSTTSVTTLSQCFAFCPVPPGLSSRRRTPGCQSTIYNPPAGKRSSRPRKRPTVATTPATTTTTICPASACR